jgi:tetratricopeptide (TPR) repeat protein
MSLPAAKADALVAEFGPLFENHLHVDEFTANRVIRECTAAIPDASLVGRAQLFGLIGHARIRLRQEQRALEAFSAAIPCQPSEYVYRGNAAACLANLGRWEDARRMLREAEALEMTRRQRIQHLGNAAEVSYRLGDSAAATTSFADAIAQLDDREPNQLFLLAVQAAAIERPFDAIELLARFVALTEHRSLSEESASEIVRSASAETLRRVSEIPVLARAVAEVDAGERTQPAALVEDLTDTQASRLAAVLDGPQEPTPALRSLVRDQRA